MIHVSLVVNSDTVTATVLSISTSTSPFPTAWTLIYTFSKNGLLNTFHKSEIHHNADHADIHISVCVIIRHKQTKHAVSECLSTSTQSSVNNWVMF